MEDHERPLNKRGRNDAPLIGAVLYSNGLVPDLILTSTALRARQTADLVAMTCDYKGKTTPCPEFYLAGPDAYLAVLARLPDDVHRVMVVGHNPGLEELLELLTGEIHAFPTAALAQVELNVSFWKDIHPLVKGKLVNLWVPKELGQHEG